MLATTHGELMREIKSPWFDPITAILMALASFGTAWCTYQGSLWNDASKDLGIQADKLERQISTLHHDALQIQSMHLRGWMEAVDAHLEGDHKRETFYTDRFSDELRIAYEKWIAFNPYDNVTAPPHPFVADLYEMRHTQEITEARKMSEQVETLSRNKNATSNNYLSNTVILAIVLFCIGMVEKFDRRNLRWASIAFSSALLMYALVRIFSLPIL